VSIKDPPFEPRGDDQQGDATQQQVSMADPLSVYFPLDGGEITQTFAEGIFTEATEALPRPVVEEQANLQNRLAGEMQIAVSNSISTHQCRRSRPMITTSTWRTRGS
jgi:hypothetical protein